MKKPASGRNVKILALIKRLLSISLFPNLSHPSILDRFLLRITSLVFFYYFDFNLKLIFYIAKKGKHRKIFAT